MGSRTIMVLMNDLEASGGRPAAHLKCLAPLLRHPARRSLQPQAPTRFMHHGSSCQEQQRHFRYLQQLQAISIQAGTSNA